MEIQLEFRVNYFDASTASGIRYVVYDDELPKLLSNYSTPILYDIINNSVSTSIAVNPIYYDC